MIKSDDGNRMTIMLCHYMDLQMADGVKPVDAIIALESTLRHVETLYKVNHGSKNITRFKGLH